MSDYLKQLQHQKLYGKPPVEKKIYRIPAKSAKKLKQEAEEKNMVGDNGLDKWFEAQMSGNKPVCAECGMKAYWLLEETDDLKKKEAYRLMWRASQAHILPKKKKYGFPSVASHPLNHLVLFPSWGGHLCGCHGFYDSNWHNASTMKIWKLVVERFKLLYPLIHPSEHKNIPEQLLKEIADI